MKSTPLLYHFGHCLHHCCIKIGGFYIISTPLKNPPAKSLHRFYTIISDFYTVPTPKFSVSTPLPHHSGIRCTHRCGHKICCQRTGYLVQIQSRNTLFDTFCKSKKLYHLYTVPISYLYHFSNFYIISISLKFSVITDTISYLYHFSVSYTIAISKWTNVISILYHWGFLENCHDKTNFSQKNKGGFPPHTESHIYYFPLHNLLRCNSDIIHKTNPFH